MDLTKQEHQATIKAIEAQPPSRKKVLWEIARILIAFSLLSGLAIGVFVFSTSQVPEVLAPSHAGWRQLMGFSVAAMAATQLACAFLLIATKRALFVWIAIALAAGLAITWLIGMMATLDSEASAQKAVKSLLIPIAYGGLLLYKVIRLKKARV
ncbi:MAG TPA: hypothetical protein VJU16_03535 [Planctomycetota bacterium]|nr:hypothetical protein [Planctomycetota bacterium]